MDEDLLMQEIDSYLDEHAQPDPYSSQGPSPTVESSSEKKSDPEGVDIHEPFEPADESLEVEPPGDLDEDPVDTWSPEQPQDAPVEIRNPDAPTDEPLSVSEPKPSAGSRLGLYTPYEPTDPDKPLWSSSIPEEAPLDLIQAEIEGAGHQFSGEIEPGGFYDFDLSEVMDIFDAKPITVDISTMMLGQKGKE